MIPQKPLKCPNCFSSNLREGVGLRGADDTEIGVWSLDGNLWQCVQCEHDGFEEDFFDNSPPGALSVSIMSEKQEV